MPSLVWPHCGGAEFEQVRYARVRFTVNVTAYGIEDTGQESVEDAGEKDESGIECSECRESFDFDTDELQTPDEFDAANHPDPCEACGEDDPDFLPCECGA